MKFIFVSNTDLNTNVKRTEKLKELRPRCVERC